MEKKGVINSPPKIYRSSEKGKSDSKALKTRSGLEKGDSYGVGQRNPQGRSIRVTEY